MSRLRNEDGFTLMEALTAVTVGFVVLAATLGLLESTVKLNTGVIAKTDAMQRGRLAMDNVTQQLRSQVCLDFSNPAILKESTADSVTFYADFSEDGKRPVKRRLVFDPVKNEIRSYQYISPSPTSPPPPDTFPTTPAVQRLELDGVTRQTDPVTGLPVPFLRYYAYKQVAGKWRAEDEMKPPLTDAMAARIARVEVNYFVKADRAKSTTKGVNLSDQVMARHADPNLSVPDPNCV